MEQGAVSRKLFLRCGLGDERWAVLFIPDFWRHSGMIKDVIMRDMIRDFQFHIEPNDVDPWAWLPDVLAHIIDQPPAARRQELLPGNWQESATLEGSAT
jgi:hypothetical protein